MKNKILATMLLVALLSAGAWFIGQNEPLGPQELVTGEHFKKPIKSSLLSAHEIKKVVSNKSINLDESIQSQEDVQNVEPLKNQAKDEIKDKRLVAASLSRLDHLLNRKYGLQLLPSSILLYNSESDRDTQALLRNSRRFIESQLLRSNNDSKLIELAQQVGINDRLIQQFKAHSRDLYSRDLNARQRSLDGSSSVAVNESRSRSNNRQQYLLNRNTSSNQYPASKSVSRPLDQARARESLKQSRSINQNKGINPAVDTLRRSLVSKISNALAKLQLNHLGLTS